MSYDLYFWRELKNLGKQPEEILELMCREEPIEGIVSFPRTEIQQRFKLEFPEINDSDVIMDWEGSGSYFEVGFTHADKDNVNCGYQLLEDTDVMNRVLKVGNSMGCALFDPQTGERYMQPETESGSGGHH